MPSYKLLHRSILSNGLTQLAPHATPNPLSLHPRYLFQSYTHYIHFTNNTNQQTLSTPHLLSTLHLQSSPLTQLTLPLIISTLLPILLIRELGMFSSSSPSCSSSHLPQLSPSYPLHLPHTCLSYPPFSLVQMSPNSTANEKATKARGSLDISFVIILTLRNLSYYLTYTT